jgi:hypothetical protein
MTQNDAQPFLIARGGPFYDLQLKARLIGAKDLNPIARALIFVAVAWGIPCIMSMAAATAYGPLAARPFLVDPGAWARFFLAIGLLVLAETQIEEHLRTAVKQLFDGPLLTTNSLGPAKAAAAKALRRRNSSLADLISLLLAILASAFLISNMQDQPPSSWAVSVDAGLTSPSLAAWWSIVISNTLFWFLLMRALWRHIIWSLLLLDFSRLETQLVAAHPDGHAGLGFVGKRLVHGGSELRHLRGCNASGPARLVHGISDQHGYGSLVGIHFRLFWHSAGRLHAVAFRSQKRTLLAASERGTEYQRQLERKTLGRNLVDGI